MIIWRYFLLILKRLGKLLLWLLPWNWKKSPPQKTPLSSSRADSTSQTNSNDTYQPPTNKNDLKEKDVQQVELERLNNPEEEWQQQQEEYRIVGFAKSIGRWTKKILDEKDAEMQFDHHGKTKQGSGVKGYWTAFIAATQMHRRKENFQDQEERRSSSASQQGGDRGR